MKSKKLLSLVLALVMALSLAVPAFASNVTESSELTRSTDITTTTETGTIKIGVPNTGAVVLNPYKMEVTPTGATSAITDQIVSATQWVINKSNVPITVNAALAATVAGNAKLATSSAKALTTNSIYLTVEGTTVDADQEEPADWNGAKSVVATAAGKAGELGVLGQGNGTKTADEDGVLAFRLSGDMAENPKTPWAATDTLTGVKITFTFVPGAYDAANAPSPTAASLTLDNSALTLDHPSLVGGSNGSSGTVTATYNAGDSTATVSSWSWTSDTSTVATVTGSTATGTVTAVGNGTAKITVTATLSDSTSVSADCTVTVGDAPTNEGGSLSASPSDVSITATGTGTTTVTFTQGPGSSLTVSSWSISSDDDSKVTYTSDSPNGNGLSTEVTLTGGGTDGQANFSVTATLSNGATATGSFTATATGN